MRSNAYWQGIYTQLHDAGHTDEEIAKIAGVGRQVINRVRNGTWPWHHDLKSAGADRIRKTLVDVQRQMKLPDVEESRE